MDVETYYDNNAHEYQKRYEGLKGEYLKSIEDKYFLDLVDYTGKTVLDFGTGPGNMVSLIIDKALHVTGIDISQEMINIAKKKITANNALFRKMDGSKLDFPDNHFDIVISRGAFESGNLDCYVSQIHRVLKKRGMFIFTVCNNTLLSRAYMNICNLLERKESDGYLKNFYTISQLKKKMAHFGFQITRYEGSFFIPVNVAVALSSRLFCKFCTKVNSLMNNPFSRQLAGVYIVLCVKN